MNTLAVVKGILTLALVIFIFYMLLRTKKSVKRYKNAKSNKRMSKTVSRSVRSKSNTKSSTSRKSRTSGKDSRNIKRNNPNKLSTYR